MGSEKARDRLAAALVELTEHGIPADVQELLVGGNPDRRVRLGALSRVLTTAREQALREAAEICRADHRMMPGNYYAARILSLLKEPTQ